MRRFPWWSAMAVLALSVPLRAQEPPATAIEVIVPGLTGDDGRVACALHADAASFPQGAGVAHDAVTPADGQGLCRFTGVPPGRYAVAVMHDANGNGRLDTNALGMPTERWGISVVEASRLRAPRFEEAAFDLGAEPLRLRITLVP